MLPIIILSTFLSLVSALRVPGHSGADLSLASLTNLDAATKANLARAYGLEPNPHAQDNTLATRASGDLLASVQAGVSFCVTLGSAINLDNGIRLDAGICLCFDAEVGVGVGGPVTCVSSSGQTIVGDLAAKLRASVLARLLLRVDTILEFVQKVVAGEIFDLDLDVGLNICLQVDLFLGHTVHDFSKVGQCCARKCAPGYMSDGNGGCTCPPANQCGNKCLTGPALLCDGECYLASGYTCPSGKPRANPVPKRRNMQECGGYGHEVCSVAGSSGYECINTMIDLESCGGCVYTERGQNQGTDCTSLPQVDEVTCHHGKCLVLSCERGFKPSSNGTACIDFDTDAEFDLVRGGGRVMAVLDGSLF